MHALTLCQKHVEWKVLPYPLQSVLSGSQKINEVGSRERFYRFPRAVVMYSTLVGKTGIEITGKKSHIIEKNKRIWIQEAFGLNTSLATC